MESKTNSIDPMLEKAQADIAADMKARGIGAILWNVATAGFHQIPEVAMPDTKHPDKPNVETVMGLYNYNGKLYEILKDHVPYKFSDFWNHDTEAAPTVVTLSEDISIKDLGDPKGKPGYTDAGTLEEWMVVANAYFEALAE